MTMGGSDNTLRGQLLAIFAAGTLGLIAAALFRFSTMRTLQKREERA
jgi:hypothetical protein